MTMAPLPLVQDTGSVLSGLTTTAVLEPSEGPKGLSVDWISWSSRFRVTDLRIDDRITHMNGEPLDHQLQPGRLYGFPGLPGEPEEWQKRGAKAGDLLRLKVWRPEGELEIQAPLVPEQLFRDADGRSALAPGGPPTLARDGFDDAWSAWYEKLVWKITQILGGSWEKGTLNTRKELVDLLEEGERIEALRKKYPGEFAERTKADWSLAVESLRGKKFEKVDLSYRELGARRLEIAKKAAAEAWEGFKKENAGQFIATFPAPDIHARAAVVGKWVELPWIQPAAVVNDLGQTWAVAADDSDGGYISRLSDSRENEAFFGTLFRFGNLVQPYTQERYQFIGEILPTPAMITYRDHPLTAHQVRLVAGRAGEAGEFFVDLRSSEPVFAGESEMKPIGADVLKDEASVAQVLDFMVDAIKRADEKAWRRVFATWRAGVYDSGRPDFLPLYVPSNAQWNSAWEDARNRIMREVYDARFDRASQVRRLFEADAQSGAPAVDQVVAYLDIIGSFDGEYRAFNHFTVHRRRVLQRVEGGPWRIVDIEGL